MSFRTLIFRGFVAILSLCLLSTSFFSHYAKYCLFLTKGAALLADITKKVPIYVHFVKKLQTFDLRALGGSFCRKFGWGAVYTFL